MTKAENTLEKEPAKIKPVAVRLFELLVDENITSDSMAEALSRNAELTRRIIAIASELELDRGQECSTLEDYVSVLGVGDIGALAIDWCLHNHSFIDRVQNEAFQLYRLQALIQAFAMNRLAELDDRLDRVEMYWCGMLMDIGMLLQLNFEGPAYGRLMCDSKSGLRSLHQHEIFQFKMSHTTTGGKILGKMGCPPSFSDIAMHHHFCMDQIDSIACRNNGHQILAAFVSSQLAAFFLENRHGQALNYAHLIGYKFLNFKGDDLNWMIHNIRCDLEEKAPWFAIDISSIPSNAILFGAAAQYIELACIRRQNRPEESAWRTSVSFRELKSILRQMECQHESNLSWSLDYFLGRLQEAIAQNRVLKGPSAMLFCSIEKKFDRDTCNESLEGRIVHFSRQLMSKLSDLGSVSRIAPNRLALIVDCQSTESLSNLMARIQHDCMRQLFGNSGSELKLNIGAAFRPFVSRDCSVAERLMDAAYQSLEQARQYRESKSILRTVIGNASGNLLSGKHVELAETQVESSAIQFS